MPAANNLAGNIVVTNATFADCPITVLTLTNENAVVDAALLSRCSLAADAPDTVELTADGASVVVTAKASVPVTARKVYDSGAYVWRFYDVNGNLITGAVDESALEADSVTVIFGSPGVGWRLADGLDVHIRSFLFRLASCGVHV